MVTALSPPILSTPTQVASQSRSGAASLASSSKNYLQATPESSLSTNQGISVGSIYKIGKNGLRRARGLAVYASVDQGVVVVNVSAPIH